jgi:hypothetical protein
VNDSNAVRCLARQRQVHADDGRILARAFSIGYYDGRLRSSKAYGLPSLIHFRLGIGVV